MEKNYQVRKPTHHEKLLIAEYILDNGQRYSATHDDLRTLLLDTDGHSPAELDLISKVKAAMIVVNDLFISVTDIFAPDSETLVQTFFTLTWGENCYCTRLIYDKAKYKMVRINILQQ